MIVICPTPLGQLEFTSSSTEILHMVEGARILISKSPEGKDPVIIY
jgi:hypothetical protein